MKHQIVTPQKQPKNVLPLLFIMLAIIGGVIFNATQPKTESAQPVKSVATTLSKGSQVLGATTAKSPILKESTAAKPNSPATTAVATLVTPLLISAQHSAYLPPSNSNLSAGYEAAVLAVAKASDNNTLPGEPSTPSAPSSNPAAGTPETTPPATAPNAPVTPPAPVCEQNGQLLVPIGGVSCSRTITTTDGLSATWLLPAAASLSDTSLPTEKPFQVFAIIESVSTSSVGYTGTSITYHLRALPTATAGVPAEVLSGNLNFAIADAAGLPTQLFTVPALVVTPSL